MTRQRQGAQTAAGRTRQSQSWRSGPSIRSGHSIPRPQLRSRQTGRRRRELQCNRTVIRKARYRRRPRDPDRKARRPLRRRPLRRRLRQDQHQDQHQTVPRKDRS